MTKQTPYQILDTLTDEQLDALTAVPAHELDSMLTSLVYSRVAKRLWGNRVEKLARKQP